MCIRDSPGDEAKTNVPAILSKRMYDSNEDLKYAYNAYNYSTERIAKEMCIRDSIRNT